MSRNMSLSDLVTIEDYVIKSKLPLNNIEATVDKLILHALHKGGDNTLLINAANGKRWSCKEILDYINKAISTFKSMGISKGDVILMHIEHDDIYAILILAAAVLGAVFAGLHYGCSTDEITRVQKLTEAKLLILDHISYTKIQSESCKIVSIESLLEAIATIEGTLDIRTFDRSLDDRVMIGFTSGSTGAPKAIEITHRYILGAMNASNEIFVGKVEGVYCTETCFNHVVDWSYFVINVVSGGEIVLYTYDTSFKLAKYIGDYKITSVMVLPSRMSRIIADVEENEYDLSSLRHIMVGGCMLPSDDIVKRFQSLFPNLKSFQCGYGMTEVGFISGQPRFIANDDFKHVGVPFPGVSIKIIDRKTGAKLGPNCVGEIYVKTNQKSHAKYLNNAAPKEGSFDIEGYLMTGDAGYYSDDGKLCITGRYKEVITCDGYDVFPVEYEDCLASHPSVSEVAVVGIDHPNMGQIAKAFIVLKAEDVTEDEIVEYHNKKVGVYYKKLGCVSFVSSMPKTFNGKIDKSKLN